jgi:uncharacterized repeat protein (TIGR03803 family)
MTTTGRRRASAMQRLAVSGTLILGAIFGTAAGAQAQTTFTLLHTFAGIAATPADGANPKGGLIADAQGNIYGATYWGAAGAGEVFRWDTNGQWTPLYTFTGFADGGMPTAGLVFDPAGNLYGATYGGGSGHGVVYELSPRANGSWTEKAIHTFTGGADGGDPFAGLILDKSGNLYGTTTTGGVLTGGGAGYGVAFELTPMAGGVWMETPLYTFAGKPDGANPYGSLIFDANGNLYGTTMNGGQGSGSGKGIVFELTPPTTTGGIWGETVLHRFAGGANDGENPQAGLTLDSSGNLYGTTLYGGQASAPGFGVVYTIPAGGAATPLHRFTGQPDGDGPYAGLIYSSTSGLLYGATYFGGLNGYGLVFSMTTGGIESQLYSFTSSGAAEPFGGLVQTPGGIYGTTYSGYGAYYYGVLFNLN